MSVPRLIIMCVFIVALAAIMIPFGSTGVSVAAISSTPWITIAGAVVVSAAIIGGVSVALTADDLDEHVESSTWHMQNGRYEITYQIDNDSRDIFRDEDLFSEFMLGFLSTRYDTLEGVSGDNIHIVSSHIGTGVPNEYRTVFTIDHLPEYDEISSGIEGLVMNPDLWCDETQMNQYVVDHPQSIGNMSITGCVRIGGHVVSDIAQNIGPTYIHPVNPAITSGYSPLLDYMRTQDLDHTRFETTILAVHAEIDATSSSIQNKGCSLDYSGKAVVAPGAAPGSPYVVSGCMKDCVGFDPSATYAGIDMTYDSPLSHVSVAAENRNHLSESNLSCSPGYHYTTGNAPKVTCDNGDGSGFYTVNDNNPVERCLRDCQPPSSPPNTFLIQDNLSATPTPLQPMELNRFSAASNYTVTCASGSSPWPAVNTVASLAMCSGDTSEYTLSGCLPDQKVPKATYLEGYSFASGVAAPLSKVEMEGPPSALGVTCDASTHGGHVKLLEANSDRDYYVPIGCYEHRHCNEEEDDKTCMQTSLMIKLEEESTFNVTGPIPNDDIVATAKDTNNPDNLVAQEVVLKLSELIQNSYSGETDAADPFEIELLKTRFIDRQNGHEIFYKVTCDADDCGFVRTMTFTDNSTVTIMPDEYVLIEDLDDDDLRRRILDESLYDNDREWCLVLNNLPDPLPIAACQGLAGDIATDPNFGQDSVIDPALLANLAQPQITTATIPLPVTTDLVMGTDSTTGPTLVPSVGGG